MKPLYQQRPNAEAERRLAYMRANAPLIFSLAFSVVVASCYVQWIGYGFLLLNAAAGVASFLCWVFNSKRQNLALISAMATIALSTAALGLVEQPFRFRSVEGLRIAAQGLGTVIASLFFCLCLSRLKKG